MAWEFDQQIQQKYWSPDILPAYSEEYNYDQSCKFYWHPEQEKELPHPGWYYTNKAFVCDDYLFYNEGWRRVHETKLEQRKGYKIVADPFDEWIINSDNSVTKTYSYVELTEEEKIRDRESKFEHLKSKRKHLLDLTDFVVIKGMEKGLTLSEEFKNYRQTLRDMPETVNLDEFEWHLDEEYWPQQPSPENYYQ